MPLYQYESLNRRGGRVKGTLDATSMQMAKEILQGQGLLPVKIAEMGGEVAGFSLQRLFERPVEEKTIILFTKQLTVLLRSAVPLLQAIELLVEQFDGRFKRILISVKEGIKSGESFAKELSRHPRVFSNVYVQLVKAGEASGKLDSILLRLTEYLERTAETKKKIKKAMAYPMFMLGLATLVVIAMITKMIPGMKSIFAQSKQALPGPTQLLVNVSDFLLGHYVAILAVLFVVVAIFTYWKSTADGQYQIDNLKLHLPLTAYFCRIKAVVQFSKTLGMLLESGVNLSEALGIVSTIVDNKVLVQKLKQAQDKIIKEGKIARYLKETGIFPSIASYMISTGEQSGKLAEMLLSVGNDYEIELSELTDSLTAKINPIMMFVIFGIVGFIMLAVLLPILGMADMSGM